MSSEEATVAVIDALGALGVPYMLVGSFSSNFYGVGNVIAVQGDRIQCDYVRSWCDRHGTRDLLEEIRRGVPPV